MDFTEKTISTKEIFDGKIVNLRVDTVTLPNGKTATRELISHPGGVGIVAVDENRQVFVVKQYRKPFDKVITEIPAGKLEYGEEPLPAAKRELEEEIGCPVTLIPNEYLLCSEAANNGRMAVDIGSGSPLTQQIDRMAFAIHDEKK